TVWFGQRPLLSSIVRGAYPIAEFPPLRKAGESAPLAGERPAKSLSEKLISECSAASSRAPGGPCDACSTLRRGGRNRGLIEHERQIVRVCIIQKYAGPFIEHIGVEIIGLEQRNASFPLRLFGLEAVELRIQRRHLPLHILLRL